MVLKNEIATALARQQKNFARKKSGLKRKALQEITLNTQHIIIITGVRRCGKSTLMFQLSETIDEEFVFFNLEDPGIYGFEVTDFIKLEEIAGEEMPVYFFDEIQNVDKWELFVRKLHDMGKKICITGSNASLLSKELGTRLTGRHLQKELFPFSYLEYCNYKNLPPGPESMSGYLEQGGFPDYLDTGNMEVLQQLFKDIIYRDIIVRHGIRNDKVMAEIALYLISNVGKEYSLNGLKKAYSLGSANSVADYIAWLEDSYLLFSLPKFSWSLKSVAVNPRKIYAIDSGLARANSLSYTTDTGRLFENMVYLHLRTQYKNLYYFKEKGECDFLIKQNEKITGAIQVCAKVHGENTRREIDGLAEALTFFDLSRGLIITLDQEDELNIADKTIKLIPAWKWMSENG